MNRDVKLQFGITENLSIERQFLVRQMYMVKCINKPNVIKFRMQRMRHLNLCTAQVSLHFLKLLCVLLQ